MPNINEYINSNEIAGYYMASTNDDYLGEELFPARKTLGLDLSWIKGSGGLPVMLQPSAFDTKATVRDRVAFGKVLTEMPFFRESMRLGEKDRQDLLTLSRVGDISIIQPILDKIYDDAGQLIESARVSAEIMRMQLISTGLINLVDNRTEYKYDFQLKPNRKVTLTTGDLWSNVDAPVFEQIQKWQDTIENETGTRPTRMVLNRNTFNLLRNNNSIKSFCYPGLDPIKIMLTDDNIRAMIKGILNISIAVYSKKYTDADGVAQFYYPNNTVTLLPDKPIGNTWYGRTPEETDLMSGATDAEVTLVNTGIAVTTIKEAHPVNVLTVVSGIFLPSGENIDSMMIITVA